MAAPGLLLRVHAGAAASDRLVLVAKLVPLHRRRDRTLGIDVGRMHVPDDFDAPLDETTLSAFEA